MSPVDPYSMTDKLDDTSIQIVVNRLEARGKQPVFAKMLGDYLDATLIDPAETVLDLGCGTGVVARAIARRRGFAGKVTGIDLSPALVANARRLSEEEGIADRVDFRAGDTRSLDLAAGTFDAVVAHLLLTHVDDPSAAIGEAVRVVRSGGMVGIFDCDFASLTLSHPDPAQGKAYDEAVIGAMVTSPRAMRQMPRLLKAAGLES